MILLAAEGGFRLHKTPRRAETFPETPKEAALAMTMGSVRRKRKRAIAKHGRTPQRDLRIAVKREKAQDRIANGIWVITFRPWGETKVSQIERQVAGNRRVGRDGAKV
ncbi:MAG: hypothetical protein IT350_20680 [Deltaproteobacteria bacterium]|nr:hypothetical protein [Deltaproteobacteria bacterium]